MKPLGVRQSVVLTVDDNPVNLEELCDLLLDAGLEVVRATSGQAAIEQADRIRPDLILLDVLMPDMDGFTLCQTFKLQAHTAQIPILFMTSLTDIASKVKGFELGAIDYITKPFQHEEVLARVTTHIALQKLKIELQDKEERLTRIFEGAMDAIVTLDKHGNVALFNGAAERLFGSGASDVLGSSLDKFLSSSLRQVLKDYRNDDAGGFSTKRAMWLRDGLNAVRLNGKEFPVEGTVSKTVASGDSIYTIILRDVNERQARQKAEAERDQLQGLNTYLEDEVRAAHNVGEMVGTSPTITNVLDMVRQVAATDAAVLITGETGTGKELVARSVHALSGRHDKVLVKLNCAAISSSLAESELFGHEKGAFTGALARKIGRFELATGGTLFLDEIGELSLDLQAKLLRVLQEGEFERVGGTQTLRCDVRIVAATNRDLVQLSREGKFRADLFYRLNVFPIPIPPLRERKEDISPLIKHFTKKYAAKLGKQIDAISDAMMTAMQHYAWPGNIRELQHLIERAVILTNGRELATVDWVHAANVSDATLPLVTLDDAERAHIVRALETTGWRIAGKNGAAEILGVPSTTLRSRMERLAIRKVS